MSSSMKDVSVRKFRVVSVGLWNFLPIPVVLKEYVERIHGELFKFLFLSIMGLLGRQASTRKRNQL